VSGVGRARRGAAALAAVAVLGACSGGDDGSPSQSRTVSTTPAATSSPTPSGEGDALATYRGMWQDMVVAARTSDYQSPLLARHAAGPALAQIVQSLYRDKKSGLVTKGQPVLNPKVFEAALAADPPRVIVEDCGDSTNWLKYRVSTGQLQDDDPGGRRLIKATVVSTGGQWKVVGIEVGGIGTC
jgi:hypothetical protein